MRRGRQRLGEVQERRSRFDSCHPEVATFATVEPALSLSKGSVYFAVSIGAAGNCTGPSSGKELPPQEDNAFEDDMWLEDDERPSGSLSPLSGRFCG